MILKPHNKKQAENIVAYCIENGMDEISTMAPWNCLVRTFKKIEILENKLKDKE